MIPQLILLSVLIFVLANFMPGDALSGQIDPSLDPDIIEQKRIDLGFYDPWYVKYSRWVDGVIHGDFGMSFRHKMPVTELLGQRLVNTLCLSLLSLFFTYLIAIPLGIVCERINDKIIDNVII